MSTATEIIQRIKAYILAEYLPGEEPSQLTATTPLVTSGVLDSIAMLRLVGFLDQEFSISIEAHEIGAENFDTIELIAGLVASKVKAT